MAELPLLPIWDVALHARGDVVLGEIAGVGQQLTRQRTEVALDLAEQVKAKQVGQGRRAAGLVGQPQPPR